MFLMVQNKMSEPPSFWVPKCLYGAEPSLTLPHMYSEKEGNITCEATEIPELICYHSET